MIPVSPRQLNFTVADLAVSIYNQDYRSPPLRQVGALGSRARAAERALIAANLGTETICYPNRSVGDEARLHTAEWLPSSPLRAVVYNGQIPKHEDTRNIISAKRTPIMTFRSIIRRVLGRMSRTVPHCQLRGGQSRESRLTAQLF